MEAITSPSRIVDLFGPGRDGFGDTPPDQTQLNASWFNNVQQELINILLDQGVVVNGLILTQVVTALNSWGWSGTPSIKSGATLSVKDGGTINVENLGALTTSDTSTVTFAGPVTQGVGATDTLTINGAATFNATTTVAAGELLESLGDNTFGTSDTDTITLNGETTVNELVSFVGPTGGANSNQTAIFEWLGSAAFKWRLSITATQSLGAGDVTKDGNDNLVYRDAVGDKQIQMNVGGWVKGYGQSDNVGPVGLASLETAVAVAPIVATTLDIHATALIKRALAGDVTVSLHDATGAVQLGVSRLISAPGLLGTDFLTLVFSRSFAADTTPRKFRLDVDGGGSDVTLKDVRITATPAI